MSDLIRRQDAIEAVGSMLRRKFGIGGDLAEITLSGLPSAQPTIDAVPVVHGEWEWIGDSEEPQDGVFMCSVCDGFVYDLVVEDCKYCPYCGAIMDGKEQNDG